MEKLSSFWSSPPKNKKLKIGFSDVSDPRVSSAIDQIRQEGWAEAIKVPAVSSETQDRYLATLVTHSKTKPVTSAEYRPLLKDSLYQGIAMLLEHEISGLVSGSLRPTADVVKAALQFVGGKDHRTLVSGHFFVESSFLSSANKTPFLFADCAVIPEPSARFLAAIAIQAAHSYEFFTQQKAKVAFLSFSTRNSAAHALVDRIKEALDIVRKSEPTLEIDGELQADAALNADVAKIKGAQDSLVAGSANVLIFPTLEAGNISYKLVQRFSGARVAGPLLWGLKLPMTDLSRGCTVQEIVDSTRILCHLAGGLN